MGRKGWKDQPKKCCIFRGELAGQPIFIGIVKGELGLQTGQFFIGARKFPGDFAQLIGFRHILRVIDRKQAATAKLQRVIQGPRLGLRRALRHHNDFKVRRQVIFPKRPAQCWYQIPRQ